jgi:short-subunit dehydrogenase
MKAANPQHPSKSLFGSAHQSGVAAVGKILKPGFKSIVLGGSTGIGYGHADLHSKLGGEVLVVGSSDVVHVAAANLRKVHGAKVTSAQVDLSDAAAVKQFLSSPAYDRFQDANILVASAGIAVKDNDPAAQIDKMMRIKEMGVRNITTDFAKRAQHGDRNVDILYVSSISSVMPTPNVVHYGRSNRAHNEDAARLSRLDGVDAFSVASGLVPTRLTSSALGNEAAIMRCWGDALPDAVLQMTLDPLNARKRLAGQNGDLAHKNIESGDTFLTGNPINAKMYQAYRAAQQMLSPDQMRTWLSHMGQMQEFLANLPPDIATKLDDRIVEGLKGMESMMDMTLTAGGAPEGWGKAMSVVGAGAGGLCGMMFGIPGAVIGASLGSAMWQGAGKSLARGVVSTGAQNVGFPMALKNAQQYLADLKNEAKKLGYRGP